VVDGWVLEGHTGGGGLVSYVDRFFAQKRCSTGVERVTAKLLLNALYGKFFQKVPVGEVETLVAELEGDNLSVWEPTTNPDLPYDYRAGGLYHPPVASLITGYVRARVHRLEHKYAAMATSTDGLFARSAPWAADVGDGLGQLTAEHGVLDIWRERLYEFQPEGPVKPKAALHGFRGSLDDLRTIPLTPGIYAYTGRHAVTLREAQSVLRGERYRAGQFASLSFQLDLTA
jgi:hypothetical protein